MGATEKVLRPLKKLQHYACRFIYGLHPFSRRSLHMHDLHWLPIKQRIEFRTALQMPSQPSEESKGIASFRTGVE